MITSVFLTWTIYIRFGRQQNSLLIVQLLPKIFMSMFVDCKANLANVFFSMFYDMILTYLNTSFFIVELYYLDRRTNECVKKETWAPDIFHFLILWFSISYILSSCIHFSFKSKKKNRYMVDTFSSIKEPNKSFTSKVLEDKRKNYFH